MKIPWAKPHLGEEELNEVIDTIRSTWISKGPKVEKLELFVKSLIGSKHCIAVNSGTAALDVALKAIEIKPGDEVIVPAFTYIATANAVLYQHAIPIFADINPRTFTIDIDDVERKITSKTKAIIAVDYGGQGPDYSRLKEIAQKRNIKIIEDSAPGFGGMQKNKMLCSFGDIGITSFHTAKIFTSVEGGMVFTDNDEYAMKSRMILNQGEDPDEKYHHPLLGHNYRMTDLHASVGLAQLSRFSQVLKKRAELAEKYTRALGEISDKITLPFVEPGNKHAWFLYPILVQNRDAIKKELKQRNIDTNVSWPLTIYQQPYFKEFNKEPCRVAERIAKEVLCLPVYYDMTSDEQDYVIKNLIEVVRQFTMEIKINGRIINSDSPCFIIAEAGVNHATEINGEYQKSLERAKKLIDAAVEAKADAVKFQTFNPDKLILPDSQSAQYHKETMGEKDNWFKRLEKEALSAEDFKELASYCRQKEITFLSTPYDKDSVDLLEKLGVCAYKIASSDSNNIPLLEYVARKNKPIILSTGMSSLDEIRESINSIIRQGNQKIIILHCVANYPIKPDECNLNVTDTLKKEFNLITGYSDHSTGILAPIVAAAKGARVIEKHLTLNKNDIGPDHRASLEPYEFREMIKCIRDTEKILGSPVKKPSLSEIENREKLMKSVVSIKDISEEEIITPDMVDVKRPGTGLAPKYLSLIIGKKTTRNIKKDRVIQKQDIKWE